MRLVTLKVEAEYFLAASGTYVSQLELPVGQLHIVT